MAIADDFRGEFGTDFTAAEIATVATTKYKFHYNFDYGVSPERDYPILYCIAHLIAVGRTTQPSATELSVSIGPVSKTYQNPQEGDFSRFFNATKYGQQFLQITMFNKGGVFV